MICICYINTISFSYVLGRVIYSWQGGSENFLFGFVGDKDRKDFLFTTETRTNLQDFGKNNSAVEGNCYFCRRERKDTIMLNPTNTQGIYLNVPMADWVLLKELIRKFGWQAETREQLLERFVKSRSNKDLLSDEEIMEEVNAVRYGK